MCNVVTNKRDRYHSIFYTTWVGVGVGSLKYLRKSKYLQELKETSQAEASSPSQCFFHILLAPWHWIYGSSRRMYVINNEICSRLVCKEHEAMKGKTSFDGEEQ